MIVGKQKGFTLIEMAIVLIILGFVLTSLLLPLRAQQEQAAQAEARNTLDIAKQALLGFAQAQGRLPCPANDASNGVESPLGGGPCTQQAGFLPAATLGIQPTDAQGFAVDGWNNRILYAVTQGLLTKATGLVVPDASFTTSNAISNLGISNINNNTQQRAMLRICIKATAFNTTCSAPPVSNETDFVTNEAVAVIYSTGATGALGSVGKADETENLNANISAPPNRIDYVFVSHTPTASGSTNGEFDHIVTWISPYVLYNAMIQAGQLH